MNDEARETEAYGELVDALRAGRLAPRGPDWRAADEALRTASRIEMKRREGGRFGLFVVAALAFLGAWVGVGASGHGLVLLAFEAATFLSLPFVGLAAVLRGTKGAIG